jgi:hypothetical protein
VLLARTSSEEALPDPKPGSRDIMDLKARLGLKPTAAPAAAAQAPASLQQARPVAQAAVPPPPGFVAPRPAAPAPPDLARDPFAVQVAAPVVQPKVDFVVPDAWDTSRPAARVHQRNLTKPLVIFGCVALVPLVVGYSCGRINAGRADVNLTIAHAQKIRDEVNQISKTNEKLEQAFDASMQRAAKQPVPDMQLLEDIKALNLQVPVTDNLFRTNYFHMKDLAIERLFAYYYTTIQLCERTSAHVRRTEADKELIAKYAKQDRTNREAGDTTFGVVIDPSGPIPVGKLVMVGQVVCKKEFKDECAKPSQWDGFEVKADQGSTPSKRFLYSQKDTERVIPIDKTALFQKVIVGSPEALAAEAYGRRLRELKELIEKIKATRKDVTKELDDQASKPRIFAL